MIQTNRNVFLSFLLLISWCIAIPTYALKTDREQPAHFVADHVLFNQKAGLTVFTGQVKMDQGTTHLIAEKVTVYSDKAGTVVKAVATGNPAHYTTLPDDQKNPIDALGDTIEYYPQEKKAVIKGNGVVTQGPNRFNGSYIVYNMIEQTVVSIPTKQGVQSVLVLQPQALPGNNKSGNSH